ncbi:hypothetical protein BTVI_64345 [Pitangus sulphuratus]|nr:hypothetical protein BTVI_64345 [Pitangus sulphuratus]
MNNLYSTSNGFFMEVHYVSLMTYNVAMMTKLHKTNNLKQNKKKVEGSGEQFCGKGPGMVASSKMNSSMSRAPAGKPANSSYMYEHGHGTQTKEKDGSPLYGAHQAISRYDIKFWALQCRKDTDKLERAFGSPQGSGHWSSCHMSRASVHFNENTKKSNALKFQNKTNLQKTIDFETSTVKEQSIMMLHMYKELQDSILTNLTYLRLVSSLDQHIQAYQIPVTAGSKSGNWSLAKPRQGLTASEFSGCVSLHRPK